MQSSRLSPSLGSRLTERLCMENMAHQVLPSSSSFPL